MRKIWIISCLTFLLAGCLTGCAEFGQPENRVNTEKQQDIQVEKEQNVLFGSWVEGNKKIEESVTELQIQGKVITPDEVPEFDGKPYIILNENKPSVTEKELEGDSYEYYSELDELGRCGIVYAKIGKDLMPTEERGAIGQVKPAGWHTIKYDWVDGKYLYNRCHLIGYQLTGENANKQNLITGTRYLNIDGMLSFENMVADYIKETSNHVFYRVTPIYREKDLLCLGLQMEACSVEDQGEALSYNVFSYNSQPGVVIDYATGASWADDSEENKTEKEPSKKQTYILNISSKKFHKSECSSVEKIEKENKKVFKGDKKELFEKGYEACKRCNP